MSGERIKEVLKSKLKTTVDGGVNDGLGQLKLMFNVLCDRFIDQIWPSIVRDLRTEWEAEQKALEKKKKEAEDKISEIASKQNVESEIKQATEGA